MAEAVTFKPKYDNHWALIIGIDKYTSVTALDRACNDARAIARVLKDKFGFPEKNMVVLLNDDATLARIRSELSKLARVTCHDDRAIIFYAGHGHTVSGNRQEAGYLVPVDGTDKDTATLLPWDELVTTSDIVKAKHVLFVMDACYGGRIGWRKLSPGATRMARDMLSRYSRQYLTAGKADQPVADGGGPRRDHSMFTGYLLDALEGGAASHEGIITANAVMAYVYDRVANDARSQQTPHHGHLFGDGDFFFTIPDVDPDPEKPADSKDILITIPASLQPPPENSSVLSIADRVKEYLSDRTHRIRLNDLVMGQLRAAKEQFDAKYFPVQASNLDAETIATTLQRYERSAGDILKTAMLIAKWADAEQQSALRQIAYSLADQSEPRNGLTVLIGLRQYPTLLTMYAAGIAALDDDNYRSLHTLLKTPVRDRYEGKMSTVQQLTVESILDVDRGEAFKRLPHFANKYVPRSEYLFTRIQPLVDDMLFLGTRYEPMFDRFEIMYALNYLDVDGGNWGPLGRFAWKHSGRFHSDRSPFGEVVEEAEHEGTNWQPLKAGFFGGSYERFKAIADRFQNDVLDKLHWM